MDPEPGLASGSRYLVAEAAGQLVALPLEACREIVPARAVTRLPGALPWVAGLLNLRGTVLTVADLSQRLGATAGTGPVVLVEDEGRRFGVRVGMVRGVWAATSDEVGVEPAQSAEGALRGVVGVAGGTAMVVDLAALRRAALADA